MKLSIVLFFVTGLALARPLETQQPTAKKPFKLPPNQPGDARVCGELSSDRRRMSEDCVGTEIYCRSGLFNQLTEANEAYDNPSQCLGARESPVLFRDAEKLASWKDL